MKRNDNLIFWRGASILFVISTSVVLSSAALGQFETVDHRDSSPRSIAASSDDWSILKIGAGGYLTGASIANDNTYVVRTDTYGAYLWNPSMTAPNGAVGSWQQLINSRSMPATFVAHAQLYNSGVYEIQLAYDNSNVMYMMYMVYLPNTYPPKIGIYKTTDKGANWTLTNFTPISSDSGNGNANTDPYRTWGSKIAVDPDDSNTVYVGTPENGLWYSTNGGSSWKQVSSNSVASPQADGHGSHPGFSGMIIDNSHNVYVYSYGRGVYKYNGSSWTLLACGTGPIYVYRAEIDFNTGYYYAIDAAQGGNLWHWNGSCWSNILAPSGNNYASAVAVDPNTSGHLIAVGYWSFLNESFDSGASWSGWTTNYSMSAANDVIWLANSLNSTYAAGAFFDRSAAKTIYVNGANGFYVTSPWSHNIVRGGAGIGTAITWNVQSRGIEEMAVNQVIAPSSNKPIAVAWDHSLFLPTLTGAYPSTLYPTGVGGSVVAAWSIDYASSDSSFIAVLADGNYAGGPQAHRYSTDGGETWNAFSPPVKTFGGNIAVSTPSNTIFAPANGKQPYYTTNFGANTTWTGIALPGVSNWTNFMGAFFWSTRVVCADRVKSNTFYLLFNGTGVFRSTDGGASWSLASGTISPGPPAQMKCTPGQAGDIWVATGSTGNPGGDQGVYGNLYHSTDGGSRWATVANVTEPYTIGFGAPKPGGRGYPAVFIVGWVRHTFGVWQSDDEGNTWRQIGTWPTNSLNQIRTISGDPNIYGQVYIGFAGSGLAYLRPPRQTGP